LKDNKKELCKNSVEEFLYQLSQKRSNNNTLNTYISSLRQLSFYFKDRGIITNAFEGIHSYPKYRPPIIILSQDEVEKIIYANTQKSRSGPKYDALLFTIQTMRMYLAYTGCRFDETASLKIKYVDLPNGKIVIPADITKNKQSRTLFITEPLVGRLKTLISGRGEDELVFKNLMGKKMHATDFSKDLRYAAKLVGVTKRVHPHLFRHTYGTFLYMATEDIGLVQVVLGHKDIKSTMIYIHIASEFIKHGMFRHPFVRSKVDPKEFIGAIEQTIRNFKLEQDPRFDYLTVKNAINEFTSKLYGSLKPQTQRYYREINNSLSDLKNMIPDNVNLHSFMEIKKIFSKIVASLVDCDNKKLKLKSFKLDNKRLFIDIINSDD
jgi:integrase